ncbi:hypothetical protein J6590_043435 [Homalodisca vitripennis]|nr:hypothetical protein J6590_043435 [Homalodisca vitripennis]
MTTYDTKLFTEVAPWLGLESHGTHCEVADLCFLYRLLSGKISGPELLSLIKLLGNDVTSGLNFFCYVSVLAFTRRVYNLHLSRVGDDT